MLSKFSKLSVVLLVATLFTACANNPIYHDYFMLGQVVEVNNQEVVLCIGSIDEKLQGETLNVHRVVYITDSLTEGEDLYRREYVGEVQIGDVINEHFARAHINSGMIKKHDIVEFK